MHLLVAAYLNYEPRDDITDVEAQESQGPPTWLGNKPGIQPSAQLAEAASTEDALAAAERLFFGELKDVEQLRRQSL